MSRYPIFIEKDDQAPAQPAETLPVPEDGDIATPKQQPSTDDDKPLE